MSEQSQWHGSVSGDPAGTSVHQLANVLERLDRNQRTETFRQLPRHLWVAVYAAMAPQKQNRELALALANLRSQEV